MKIITNDKNACMGVFLHQRVVSYLIKSNDQQNYIALCTDGIADCLGIGIYIYENNKKDKKYLKQMSLHHSLSEHSSLREEMIKYYLNEYRALSFDRRKELLDPKIDKSLHFTTAHDDFYQHYFACSFVQMLTSLSSGNYIEMLLHTGLQDLLLDSDSKYQRAKDDLINWFHYYAEVSGIDFTFNIIKANGSDKSMFFAIDNDGVIYEKEQIYQESLDKKCTKNDMFLWFNQSKIAIYNHFFVKPH